jgi:hypothetical protein
LDGFKETVYQGSGQRGNDSEEVILCVFTSIFMDFYMVYMCLYVYQGSVGQRDNDSEEVILCVYRYLHRFIWYVGICIYIKIDVLICISRIWTDRK